ncbi:MAG: nucleoside deaminase [Xanthomonadales bacterium]|nr:nucleoside deaminase [Xanthomonadales bacterium]
MDIRNRCAIELPGWVTAWARENGQGLTDPDSRMAFVIELSAENVRRGSGGPFAAAIFDPRSNGPISLGVNLVTSSGLSMAHAEMVAISLAQERLGNWDLKTQGSLALYSSCEPCAMCFGAVPWSGVSSLVCGASKSDAESAGFDEGHKPADWRQGLQARGIDVVTGLLRERAAEVLQTYRQRGGPIYNPGQAPVE